MSASKTLRGVVKAGLRKGGAVVLREKLLEEKSEGTEFVAAGGPGVDGRGFEGVLCVRWKMEGGWTCGLPPNVLKLEDAKESNVASC